MLIIKGTGKKINLNFTDDTTLEEMISDLRKEEKFFKNAGCIISYSGVELDYSEEMILEKEIREISENLVLEKKRRLSSDEIRYSLDENERILRVVEGNVRSGEVIKNRGDVIVYGDVNPGALIIARGNITVIGALRGTVRIEGDGKVYATYMSPSQIKIGDVCSYNKNGENVGSALALAENGEIILESL